MTPATVEVQNGRSLPAFDTVERVDLVLAALPVEEGWEPHEPAISGAAALRDVHDADLLAFLEAAWERCRHLAVGLDAAFADTFAHLALVDVAEPVPDPGPAAALGRYCFDTIGGVQEGTWVAALGAVDVAASAADAVLRGARLAVGLTRPPGHHATRRAFGGGCFLNNDAVAATTLLRGGADHVVVLDVDAHHGNGTQAIFYERPEVHVVSLHGDPRTTYPFHTGHPEEVGRGPGRGANTNLVLPPAADGRTYLTVLERALHVVDRAAPDAVVLTLGVDTGDGDPAEVARLTPEDLAAVGDAIGALGRPVVALLAGGYRPDTLGPLVAGALGGLRSRLCAPSEVTRER